MDQPDLRQARVLLGQIYLRRGRARDALAVTENRLREHPDDLGLLEVVGRARLRVGRAADAAIALRKLADALPASAQARYFLAMSYKALKDTTRFRRNLERVLEIDPDHKRAKMAMFSALVADQELEAAKALLHQLKLSAPDDPSIIELDGGLAMLEKRYADAVLLFESAIAMRPANFLTLKLSVAQQRAGDITASRATLQTWLKKSPDDPGIRLALANQDLLTDRMDAARSNFAALVEIAPDHVVALNNLAWLLLTSGDAEGALPHAERALRLAADNPRVMDTAGLVLLELGKTARALSLLRGAAADSPDNPEIRFHLAQALVEGGEGDEAQDILEQILVASPEFPKSAEVKALLDRID